MALTATFRWQSPDSTNLLNNRLNRLVQKGLVWGGSVAPGVGLHVTLDPFVAVSHEGLTVVSDAVENLVVAAGASPQPNVIVAYTKYNPFGTPAVPIEQIQVLDWVTYNGHPDKQYMNVLAEVNLLPAAVIVNPNDISFVNRDEVTPVGRSQFRGTCVFATLPVPASPTNRVGDFYWVSDHKVFYFWTGTVWEPINTGSYNSEVLLHNQQLVDSERTRMTEGFGVVSGVRRDDINEYSAKPNVDVISVLAPNVLRLDAFAANINGHYLETKRTDITLDPPPAVGDRFDIVFVESWRAAVVDPNTVTYANNAGPPYTVTQASDIVEQDAWAPATTAFDLHSVDVRNHFFNNVQFRFGFVQNVSPTCLHDYHSAAALCSNVDGNPFVYNFRYWSAVAPSAVDGKSYALPLFIVRRVAGEIQILEFRSNVRHVFPVYTLADAANLVKQGFDAAYWGDDAAASVYNGNSTSEVSTKPSGFISGNKTVLSTQGAANTIRWYDFATPPKVRCRGFEDMLGGLPNDIQIGVAPGAGHTRQLVYLQMTASMFADATSASDMRYVSTRLFPFVKSKEGSDLDYFAWRRGFITWEIKVESLGASAVTDEDEAFTALGWAKATTGDGGLWQKAVGGPTGYYNSTDYRINYFGTYFAVPICLLHRRNSAAWNYNTNPNGSTGRADGHTSASIIYVEDVLADLRHSVDISEEDLKSLLESDIDKAMKGQLRTRGANKYLGSGLGGVVGGSRVLQSDSIGPVAGAYQLPSGDGYKRIWSDAKEYHVVAASFSLTTGLPADPTLFSYVIVGVPGNPGAYGTLTINAPPGAHLIRHVPGVTYTNARSADAAYMEFYGPPCWSTRHLAYDVAAISASMAKYVNTVSSIEGTIEFCPYTAPGTAMSPNAVYQPFDVLTTDDFGRATSMRGYINLEDAGVAPDLLADRMATLSWWVHYDRSYIATADNYHTNYGLGEIPDEVHQAILDPLGVPTTVNVGPLCVSVRKACAAASFTITAADVAALLGLGGVTTLAGVDVTSASYSAASSVVVNSVTLDTATETTLTIGLSGVFVGNVDLLVFFKNSALTNWIEVGRGGKSVQAKFEWQTTNRSAAITEPYYAVNLGSNTWNQVEYAGRRLSCMPFIWHKTNIGDAWELHLATALFMSKADYEYSNVLTFPSAPFAGENFFKIIFPIHKPLTAAATDNLLMHYTYTPYQGLSSDGGKAAVIGTALPKLKNLIHGTVVEDGDWYATQSGPCSYFSGVHALSGFPVNRAAVTKEYLLFFNRESGFLEGMFPEYNGTWLVKAPGTTTKYNLESSGVFKDSKNLNTPAILRLPYPTHSSIAYLQYTKGPMEFDFDPCRAGSASGYLTMAPAYPSPCQGTVGWASKTSQFSNGLSPFAASLVEGYCESHGASEYSTLQNSVNVVRRIDYLNCALVGDDLYVGMHLGGAGDRICRSMARYSGITANTYLLQTAGVALIPPQNGTLLPVASGPGAYLWSDGAGLMDYFARYTYKVAVPGVNTEVFVGIHPGEILQWAYATQDPATIAEFYPQHLNVGDVGGLRLWAPIVLGERGGITRTKNVSGTLQTYSSSFAQRIDTIKIPSGFGQGKSATPTGWNLAGTDYMSNGRFSLKGLSVSYPTSWTAPMVAFADGLWQASHDLRGAGRGLYCGSSSSRFASPVLVPGSGTDLPAMLRVLDLHTVPNMESPDTYAYTTGTPLFDDPIRGYFHSDRGGPMAYVFRGLLVNPSAAAYKNRVVIQIAGGPNGGPVLNDDTIYGQGNGQFNPNDLTATAIDAFWPSGRPILAKR